MTKASKGGRLGGSIVESQAVSLWLRDLCG